ncbi:MAG: hypothetical protein Q9188_004687 [Gyalolechia gomerana]
MAEQRLPISQGLDIPHESTENMSNAVNDGSTKDKSIEINDDSDEAPANPHHTGQETKRRSTATRDYPSKKHCESKPTTNKPARDPRFENLHDAMMALENWLPTEEGESWMAKRCRYLKESYTLKKLRQEREMAPPPGSSADPFPNLQTEIRQQEERVVAAWKEVLATNDALELKGIGEENDADVCAKGGE